MDTVAFYSYKGGVGRSLLLGNTARFLALTGRRVVALDLDFEAPGLHYKLGVEEKVETGAVRLLQRSLDGDLPTLDDVRNATVEVPMPATHGGWLRLVAAGPAPKGEYWADLGRLHELLLANQDAGLLEAVLDLQARIEDAWSPDVLLVDARTGVTGLGGIATMAVCDRVVLLTTRSRESLDGILAVAESLRATPTLRGEMRRLEFLVSRVQGTEVVDDRELGEALGEYSELPNDRYDGGAERHLGSGPPLRAEFWWETRRLDESLLARTLSWIPKLFPTQADEAARAQSRLVAVEEAWRELTKPSKHSAGGLGRDRWQWSPRMLAANIEFSGSDGSTRTADIAARLNNGELAMIIEHLDDEPSQDVARWWSEHVQTRVVVLQWKKYDGSATERITFLGRGVEQDQKRRQGVSHLDPRYIPMPIEFELVCDPTVRPIEAMLEMALHTRFYDTRLVAEWVQCTVISRLPKQAKKILDGLAAIEHVTQAFELVNTCADCARSKDNLLQYPYDYFDRPILEGLVAPLCWRAPPLTFIALARDNGGHGFRPGFYALRRLANFMGLDYDPLFRRESPKTRELELQWSTDPLPFPSPDGISGASHAPTHGYHGYLGSYDFTTSHIVLSEPSIDSVAKSLDRPPRHVGSVALLHFSVLGLLHNGVDLDDHRWDSFSLGDLAPQGDEMLPVTIALIQFFVHRFLVELGDERLQDAFEALTDSQPPEYGAWRAMTHIALEDGRAWMVSVRHGTGVPAPIDLGAFLRSR